MATADSKINPPDDLHDLEWTDPAAWLRHMGEVWPDGDLNGAKARAAAAGVRLGLALARGDAEAARSASAARRVAEDDRRDLLRQAAEMRRMLLDAAESENALACRQWRAIDPDVRSKLWIAERLDGLIRAGSSVA